MLKNATIDKEILEGYLAEGLSTHEIATKLGCSQPKVARNCIFHGLRSTRKPGPRPTYSKECVDCGGLATSSASPKCRRCYIKGKLVEYGQTKLDELSATNSRHRYQAARHHAARVVKFYGVPRECRECGYSKYVELCHIKAIGLFPDETKLSEVNALSNLAFLCPNHHKELDLGL